MAKKIPVGIVRQQHLGPPAGAQQESAASLCLSIQKVAREMTRGLLGLEDDRKARFQ